MRRVIVALAALAAALVLTSCAATDRQTGAVDAPRDNAIGPANASVTIEEWGDFQCPACRTFDALQPRIDQVLLSDGRTRFVFRHMAFLGPESIVAAEASECAGDQGRFWDYHDVMYASQDGENRGAFATPHLKEFAATLNLESTAFNACLDSHKYTSRVKMETERGRSLGVNSTPTLTVNGQRVSVTNSRDPVETLRLAVETARTRK